MSTNHTPNYQLSQWEPSDQFRRTDFNEDNAKIDAALSALTGRVSSAESSLAGKANQSSLNSVSASVPKVKAGTYTGNGAASQDVWVGFTPKAVLVLPSNCDLGRFSGLPIYFTALAVAGRDAVAPGSLRALSVTSGGFRAFEAQDSTYTVSLNSSGLTYCYIALG